MKVRELIEALQKENPDAEVYVFDYRLAEWCSPDHEIYHPSNLPESFFNDERPAGPWIGI